MEIAEIAQKAIGLKLSDTRDKHSEIHDSIQRLNLDEANTLSKLIGLTDRKDAEHSTKDPDDARLGILLAVCQRKVELFIDEVLTPKSDRDLSWFLEIMEIVFPHVWLMSYVANRLAERATELPDDAVGKSNLCAIASTAYLVAGLGSWEELHEYG